MDINTNILFISVNFMQTLLLCSFVVLVFRVYTCVGFFVFAFFEVSDRLGMSFLALSKISNRLRMLILALIVLLVSLRMYISLSVRQPRVSNCCVEKIIFLPYQNLSIFKKVSISCLPIDPLFPP